MRLESPTFTCDACGRPLGLHFKNEDLAAEREHMAQFPLHFCNNNCRMSYQKENGFDRHIYWLAIDWPKVTASLR